MTNDGPQPVNDLALDSAGLSDGSEGPTPATKCGGSNAIRLQEIATGQPDFLVLKNTGATDATSTEIVATFYGADGEVVAVGLLGTAVGTLGPGQTVSFDVQAYPDEATPQIASYALQVQCALPDE